MANPTGERYSGPLPIRFGNAGVSPSDPPPPPTLPVLVVTSGAVSGYVGVSAVGPTITNNGPGSCAWSILASPATMTLSPSSGTLASGASISVTVTPQAAGPYTMTISNVSGGAVSGASQSFSITGPSTLTVSGASSGAVGYNIPLTFTLDHPATSAVTINLSGSGLTLPAAPTIAIGGTSTSANVSASAAGTYAMAISTTPSLTISPAPPWALTISAASTSADWTARSTGADVVWAHNFEQDEEVSEHEWSLDPTDPPAIRIRRVIDETGIGCVEQVVLGAQLAAPFTAGSTTMVIDDATYWPNPATDGSFRFCVSRQYGTGPGGGTGDKNVFLCTARSGTTLTVSYVDKTGVSAFYPYVANSYAVGDYAGSYEAGEWRRVFSALPAGENGLSTDDPAASGAVPLRSRLSGNSYSVPRDPSIWQYGFYGHVSYHTTDQDWTPWVGSTTYTPRGVSQGVADKYRLWDGDEYWIQFRIKIDARFWALNLQRPDSNTTNNYFGRKLWAMQSEISGLGQVVTGIAPSNRYSIPSTNNTPFELNTYKAQAAHTFGVEPWRTPPLSNQKNSGWDVSPYYANLNTSFLPSTGCATPDGAAAWEMKDGEWVTFLVHMKPGRSGVHESTVEVKFARTEDPAYDGTYTTLLSITDGNIVYSGSGDDDYPDGVMPSYPTMPRYDALRGHQAFGIMGYLNITQSVDIPPPMASYYVRMAQVIFSKADIPPPASDVRPSWVPEPGDAAVLTVANGGLANSFSDVQTPWYTQFWSDQVVNSDSGSVVNPYWGTYGAIVFHGGGHSGSNNNGVYLLELGASTCTFKRPVNGAAIFGSGTDSITQAKNEGYDEPTYQVSMSAAYGEYTTAGLTPSAQPAAPHSCGALDIIPPSAGGAACGTLQTIVVLAPGHNGNTNDGGIRGTVPSAHHVDFDTATGANGSYAWERTTNNNMSTYSSNGGAVWTEFVEAQDRIYFLDHNAGSSGKKVMWFDRATNTYVTGTNNAHNNANDGGGRMGATCYVPERDLLIYADRRSGNFSFQYMSVGVADTDPQWSAVRTASVSFAVDAGFCAICWCPDNSRLLVGSLAGDANSVYEIEIPATLSDPWTATHVAMGGGVSWEWASGGGLAGAPSYKKWSYNTRTKSIVYFGNARSHGVGTEKVFVYRPRNT